jgi:uncharacterized peroxidase-related enzyme
MARIRPVDPAIARGKAADLLAGVARTLGSVPNLMRGLAHSPAALQAYLGFNAALAGGKLSARVREQIALAVAGANSCEYCAAAHAFLGGRLGVGAQEAQANLAGSSSDPDVEAVLEFARQVVARRGWVDDADVDRLRDAGYGDAELVEIIATVAINIFTNYFNHAARTEVDFPRVELPAVAAT